MRRADRLFDIIQALRTAKGPLTAAALAERLEVTERTIYRDIAALQARRKGIGEGFALANVDNAEPAEVSVLGT